MYHLEIPGFATEGDLIEIEKIAQGVPPNGFVIEIGSFCGRTAFVWAMTPRAAHVICIDTWTGAPLSPSSIGHLEKATVQRPSYDMSGFIKYMRGISNVTAIQSHSTDFLSRLDSQSVDVVFLDGSRKRGIFEDDLDEATRALKSGGVLCGRGFSRLFPDVMAGVAAVAKRMDRPVRFAPDPKATVWSINL